MAITVLKLTSKGQVTFRKDLLQHFGLHPGDSVIFEYDDAAGGTFRPAPKKKLERLFGSLRPPGGKRLSLEEIDATIRRQGRGED